MNDQHPHAAGYAGYDGHSTRSFDSDPLFGSLPGTYDASYDTTGGYGIPYTDGQADHTGSYDATQWDTGAHHTFGTGQYDAYPAYADQTQQHPQCDGMPQYDTATTWLPTEGYAPGIPSQGGAPDTSGQWDTTTWTTATAWPADDTASYDTGVYDATAWNTGATPGHEEQNVQSPAASNEAEQSAPSESYESYEAYDHTGSYDYDPYEPYRTADESGDGTGGHPVPVDEADAEDTEHPALAPAGTRRDAARPAARTGGRSRRRTPAKRSALLTVAVPSACVMSVAGIAAASVSGMGGGETKKDATTTMAAADPGTVKPVAANNALDTQLANLSADAENFADRASRTQERIDLKARQAAEKKKRAEEAARKEALRPKFVLPVKQHGLSAYFGQAGVNWMSVHTGIDFPVQYGTPVMAATDGTVRTQYNSAYGNMAIVTMADGTETWYCHLSSTRIRSGQVKAGDVIAYSGNSGNSTGPHMHFEVRPGGGAAIDPLPWLRSHGIDPT
ncbi:Murein DD-endopeptidase MepM and murein hydrolase activator NlpD, contain LysM domain [Streptomyces sp. 2131.1]|uniref:M23 family metallopeptidase n=1 Tax=Streptomyces sp. 2131.1 TaxID=1855346 RepID=UPI0008982564|nr:M23 family metallopeptidase [Streptomyces sp. 2131.1]SEC78948.1 Murein DD-endopeptidase MepM and murein hydrolase activator NlpD, contain LysM domain [Streptomyces sp. 2131.1]